jgi:DNA-binding NtrC family response regulator
MTTAMIPSTLVPNHASSFKTPAFLNVLIVDDERPTREACREAAAALGCRTTVTDSVERALRLVGSQNIDVVLLSLNLSNAVRLQVVRQITQKRNGIEVAIATTNPAAEPAIEAMRAGASDCLIKPFGSKNCAACWSASRPSIKPGLQVASSVNKSRPPALAA